MTRQVSKLSYLGLSLLLFTSAEQAGFAQLQAQSKSPKAIEKTQGKRIVQSVEIPKAPVAEVEIKELKTSIAVDVLASHSKVFKTKQKITRVAVSDPSVADVVLMTEHQFCVIGKTPGAISVTIWCENSGQ